MADRTREDDPLGRSAQPPEPDTAPPAAAGPLGAGLGAANVIALQSAAGNAAASRMLSGGGAAHVARAGMVDGGAPLDDRVRDRFEPAFGTDFSGVRVHTDPQTAGAAGALHARAYTVGGDIVFNEGEYAPGSSGGQELIAHELAHVVQQGDGAGVPDQLEVSQPGDALERDADAAASAVMHGAPAPVRRPRPAPPASPSRASPRARRGSRTASTSAARDMRR